MIVMGIQMNNEEEIEDSIPPPNWSPTGNSGNWVWERRKANQSWSGATESCWHWVDDVYGYDWVASIGRKPKREKPICQ